jgi:mitotic spindle assembly checkpoint protein MAD2
MSTQSQLSLRGSSITIAEFFEYSIHSILYQRGIYPPEDFITVKKYGLNLLISDDDEVKGYIKRIIRYVYKWLIKGDITKLVLVILDKDGGEVVERWEFNILNENKSSSPDDGEQSGHVTQSDKEPDDQSSTTQKDIQTIIRQITASITFLPQLNPMDYTFNVLVYTDSSTTVSSDWLDSDAKDVVNGESVRFKSFNTKVHKVDTLVSYKLNE